MSTVTSENHLPQPFLSSVLESAVNGIMVFASLRNEEGKIIDFTWQFANEEAGKIINQNPVKLLGQRLLEVMPNNRKTGLFASYKEVVETGEPMDLEQLYPMRAGDRWFRISAAKFEDGFTVNFHDITPYKQALLEAKVQQQKYQMLFSESMDAIFLMDTQFRIMEANDAFDPWLISAQPLPFALQALFAEPEDWKTVKQELTENRIIEEYEFSWTGANGKRRSALLNCVAIVADEGKSAYLGVLRDITKRKQADRDLLLTEKLAMTGKLARTIAHEVRNPLTNLTLALDQLEDEIPDSVEDADLYMSIIRRNADRVGTLITDLLNSSKPKLLEKKPTQINAVVEEALSLIRDRIRLKEMKLEVVLGKNLPEVSLDASQLQVAFVNLGINALEAMKPGQGVLTVTTQEEDDCVIVSFADNGRGIPPEDQAKLFDPFFTAKKGGTGLGLTTVQNLVQSHEGTIRVESTLGEGTTFIASFPPVR